MNETSSVQNCRPLWKYLVPRVKINKKLLSMKCKRPLILHYNWTLHPKTKFLHNLETDHILPVRRSNTLPQGTICRNISCFNTKHGKVAPILLLNKNLAVIIICYWVTHKHQLYIDRDKPECQGIIAYRSYPYRTHFVPIHLSLPLLVSVHPDVFFEATILFS